jgi:hypothetical protein
MLGDLITASHLTTMEQLPGVVAEHAARGGWPQVLVYLVDLQEEVLHLLTGEGPDAGEGAVAEPATLRVDGTVAGRAFQLGRILPASAESDGRWWVPLLDGTERLGVLRVTGDAERAAMEEDAAAEVMELAGLIALMVVGKRATSDSHARLVRRRHMNVTAELGWRLAPPRTFATDRVFISAVMEPAYEVSGDAFDYAVSAETVHLGVFDAMGHDAAAGLTASIAVAAARNHRRQGTGTLLDSADAVEEALVEQFGESRYATGVLADLDMTTGELSWTARGHPLPVIVRHGRTVVPLACPPGPPMGTGLGLPSTLCRDRLEPGDRLLLYTDGITEARSREGHEFGLERLTDFLIRHNADGLPLPETLRRLIHQHLDYHQGRLEDDATVLLLEWHGPHPYRPEDVESLVGLPENAVPPDLLRTAWRAGGTGERTPGLRT